MNRVLLFRSYIWKIVLQIEYAAREIQLQDHDSVLLTHRDKPPGLFEISFLILLDPIESRFMPSLCFLTKFSFCAYLQWRNDCKESSNGNVLICFLYMPLLMLVSILWDIFSSSIFVAGMGCHTLMKPFEV